MIVAFDASILIYVIDEQAKPPIDSATGKPVDRCHERVRRLLESLQQQNASLRSSFRRRRWRKCWCAR